MALLTLSSAHKSGRAGTRKDCLKWKCIGPWHILLERRCKCKGIAVERKFSSPLNSGATEGTKRLEKR